MPRVSVIVPVYNSAGTLSRSVGSVLRQSEQDWELIAVDDGSTDESARVLEELVSGDKRVKVIRQQNAGSSAARNRGLREASTGLVAFLDADDQWMDSFLETVLGVREHFPQCALWGARYVTVNPQRKRMGPGNTVLPGADELIIENYLALAGGGVPPVRPGSAIMLKDALLDAGGFPEGVRWGEDLDTWLRLSLRHSFALSPILGLICDVGSPGRISRSALERQYPLLAPEVESSYTSQIDPMRRGDLAEYFNWMRLNAARDCLRLGQRRTARGLLELSRDTQRHRAAWRNAYLKSLLPGPVMKALAGLRARG